MKDKKMTFTIESNKAYEYTLYQSPKSKMFYDFRYEVEAKSLLSGNIKIASFRSFKSMPEVISDFETINEKLQYYNADELYKYL